MDISKLQLMNHSTAFIEDDVLKKWRYVGDNDINKKIHDKVDTDILLTKEELAHIKEYDNVTMINGSSVRFINFNATIDIGWLR